MINLDFIKLIAIGTMNIVYFQNNSTSNMYNYQRRWMNNQSISANHIKIKISQIYCWLITSDKKTIIVTKNKNDWQIPGGHPKSTESFKETLIREVFEETGIKIKKHINRAKFFGYYLVDKINNKKIIAETLLQIRYILLLPQSSNQIVINIQENLTDPEQSKIKYAKFVNDNQLTTTIPWMKNTEEYRYIKQFLT